MNHPWWHNLFTYWIGSEHSRSIIHKWDAKWETDYHFIKYWCPICLKEHKKDMLTNKWINT